MLLGTALLWSCSSDSIEKNIPTSNKGVTFKASLDGYTSTRAKGSSWSAADKIGVYAVKSGELISNSPVDIENYNILYATVLGDGSFTSNAPIKLDGKTAKNIIAYYPYTEHLNGGVYDIDVKDQSNSEAIDLLYANNVTGLKENGEANLEFTHKLSRFIVKIQKGTGIESLDGLSVNSLTGVTTKGSMNLDSGELTLGESKEAITNLQLTDEADKKVITTLLIPGQSSSLAKLEIAFDGKNYTWEGFKDIQLASGLDYIFNGKISKNDQEEIVLVINGAIIKPWGVGYEDEDVTDLNPNDPAVETNFELDFTSFNVEATSGLKTVSISTDENQEWTVTSSAEWVSVEPTTGKGSSDVHIYFDTNTETSPRSGIVTFTANEKHIEVVVNQKAKEVIIEPEELFLESLGTNAGEMASKEYIADYGYFDNSGVTYSDPSGRSTMRTLNGVNVVFMPNGGTASFKMENLNIKNAESLQLKFSFGSGGIAKTENYNGTDLQLKVNGEVISHNLEFNRADINDKMYLDATVDLSVTEVNSIEFINGNSKYFARINNIRVLGIKK